MSTKKYRVLVAGIIEGQSVRPDDVIALTDVTARQHAAAIDGDKEAVAHAIEINGGKVIDSTAKQEKSK